jgi:cytochrome c biogenesis protein CcdA/thiol-disulfide isomerase/thioredoxin
MVLLLLIGFLAGIVTAISPCVLPVLPILLAGGAAGGRRRPYAIIAGLVLSFVVFTLSAAWIIDQLGLPDDFLRNAALVLLFVVAATLLVPRLGEVLERPFLPLTRRRPAGSSGGFVLGLSLGLVFVPCAGPIFGYVAVRAGSEHLNSKAVLLIVAYSLGAAVPMLLVALGGRGISSKLRGPLARPALGVVMALAGIAIVFHVDTKAQTAIGGYTNTIQGWFERTDYVNRHLNGGRAGPKLVSAATAAQLADYGRAPDFSRISDWLNTPGDRPLSLASLHGKVVLIDFWTYSCINCLRTLPHLEAWDRAYRKDGLVIVGVHTPEFAFEHSLPNVRAATRRLGVHYPVALDNDYGTWDAYSNQYWPAEYLLDRRGHVRHYHFGEGEYGRTEQLIRHLLAMPGTHLPTTAAIADRTPMAVTTPESYLGYERLDRYAGSRITRDRFATYRFPQTLPLDHLAYGGSWLVRGEGILAGRQARLRLHFHAHDVYLVLGGSGSVHLLVDGHAAGTVRVTGDRLYTLLSQKKLREGLLELRFSPGIEAYAFTFG